VCPTARDTVTFNAPATSWISSGGGTLTVQCETTVKTDTLKDCVAMNVTWVNQEGTFTRPLLYTTNGTWVLTGERSVKQPTRLTCSSKLGGGVTARGVP
jgi:hypothetical protein